MLYGNVDICMVNFSFCVGGCVELLVVDEGDVIKVGQVLGELDYKLYEIVLMQVKVGVLVVQVQYDLMFVGYCDEEIVQVVVVVKQV